MHMPEGQVSFSHDIQTYSWHEVQRSSFRRHQRLRSVFASRFIFVQAPSPQGLLHGRIKLVHASIQVHDDIDGSDQDLGGDEHDDDPFEVLACKPEQVSPHPLTTPPLSIQHPQRRRKE